MKKIQLFALLSAIALTGLGFSSCSSDELGEVNPTYDGKTVKTQFAINIPAADQNTTRQTTTIVQESGFRGITNMNLFALTTAPSDGMTFPYGVISLDALSFDSPTSGNQQQRVYSDVTIPVGTSSFLFYGEASGNSASSDDIAAKYETGVLDRTVTSATGASDVGFALVPIVGTADYTTPENTLVGYLNAIAAASADGTTWASMVKTETDDTYEAMEKAYDEFTKQGRVIAGSGAAVLSTVSLLYNRISRIQKSSSPDTPIYKVCAAIMTEIDNAFTATYDASKEGQPSATSPDHMADCYTLAYKSTDATVTTFPETFGLPQGAAQIKCEVNATSRAATFSYIGAGSATINNMAAIGKLCYPASLQYFVNTPLVATNKKMEISDWPNTVGAWTTGTIFSDWTTSVTATSKNIALRNNIQYGVARLATTVKCQGVGANGSGSGNFLEDNSKTTVVNPGDAETGGGYENYIYVPIPTAGFDVTGIMIGSQPKQVGWDFLMESASDGVDRSYVVVDEFSKSTTASTLKAANGTPSSTNYTMVLDNYLSTTINSESTYAPEPVLVCLELTNNSSKDFYGADGMILVGQKFYLVGKLDPNAEAAPTWPTGAVDAENRVPAYQKNRVFIQDFTTTANFTIKDLKKAYVTIPDLRTPEISLGLSVDLTWNPGVTYDISTFE